MDLDLKIAQSIKVLMSKYINIRRVSQQVKEDREWNKLFLDKSKFISKINSQLSIFMYKDSLLSQLIYKGFEESEILFLRRYLRPADTFIDIGSNIGLFSLHASQIVTNSGKVHAFEPTPITFSRLKENIDLNKCNEIISVNNIGVSNEKGYLSLNVSTDGHDAWNTFAHQSDVKFEKQVLIPVDTLDNYFAENKVNVSDVSLIKIDVEGWELAVLIGATSVLNCLDSPVLMVEFTENNLFAAGTNCYEVYDLVTSFGYKWYIYDASTNKLLHDPKRIHYPYNNLFAIKNIDQVRERITK